MKNKKSILSFSIVAVLLVNTVFGQTFLNGSFESTTGNCSFNLTNFEFNSLMSNCYAFGLNAQIDIINNGCGYGNAQDGNSFIGLAVDNTNTLTDALSLKLATPILAGESYLLSFYHRKDAGFNANLIEVGYSNDSLSFGTSIGSTSIPTTLWDIVTFSFSPTVTSNYISLQTIAGAYGWNFVDNFTLTQVTNTSNLFDENIDIVVFPNPCADVIHIKTNKPDNAFKASIRDIQGRVIFVAVQSTIDLSALQAGIYLLEVETAKGKVIKQIVKNP